MKLPESFKHLTIIKITITAIISAALLIVPVNLILSGCGSTILGLGGCYSFAIYLLKLIFY